MDNGSVPPDFGAGLSLDEMVGMMAWEISRAALPTGQAYQAVGQAAERMVVGGLKAYMLMEVWADGHTLWHGMRRDDPVVVTPAGELIRTR
jgi:hypothetical protein